MDGIDDKLILYLLALGLGAAVLSALLTWAAARRYGRSRGLLIPVLAMLAVAVQLWRSTGTAGHDPLWAAIVALIFAGPAVAGGLLGLALAGRRKG